VIVEGNVWRDGGWIFLEGVRIGENSVVAAGAVVVEDIPANVLAAGCPARVIKTYKPDDETSDLEF